MDLLTGSTGYLGRHLARRLAADGRQLRALVKVGTDLKRIPREISDVIWGGFDDPHALARATHGVDTIFHVAARVSAGGGRELFERDNLLATESLLEAAAAAGCRRFVHVSSAGIYGTNAAASEITESTPLDPAIEKRGAYAWSKAAADELARRLGRERGIDVVVVRPGILYGAEAKPFLGRLSFSVPRSKNRRIIVGSHDALLPLTHVDNACDAIALASLHGRPGAAYNVVDGTISQGEFFDLLDREGVVSMRTTYVASRWLVPLALGCEVLTRLSGISLPLTRYKLRRATESLRYSTRAAQDDLGWRPAVDPPSGVAGMRTFRAPPTTSQSSAPAAG
jgi:nucleoside-diphosphate-sugar epimerase